MNSTIVASQVSVLGQMILNLRLVHYYLALIILIPSGIFGNLVSVVVFTRKSFRETAMGKYMIAQSISDLVFQTYAINQYLIQHYEQFLCQVVWTVNVSGMVFNALMKTAVSLDRLILVRFPTRFCFIKKTWFQCSVIVTTFCLTCIPVITAQSFIKYEFVRNNVRLCYVLPDVVSQAGIAVTRYWNLYLGHCIPFSIMTFCGIVIIRKVFEMKAKSKKSTSSSTNRELILTVYTVFCISYFLLMSILFVGVLIFQIYYYNPKVFNEPYILSIEIGQFLKNFEINTSFFCYLIFNKIYRSELTSILIAMANKISGGRIKAPSKPGETSFGKTLSTL